MRTAMHANMCHAKLSCEALTLKAPANPNPQMSKSGQCAAPASASPHVAGSLQGPALWDRITEVYDSVRGSALLLCCVCVCDLFVPLFLFLSFAC